MGRGRAVGASGEGGHSWEPCAEATMQCQETAQLSPTNPQEWPPSALVSRPRYASYDLLIRTPQGQILLPALCTVPSLGPKSTIVSPMTSGLSVASPQTLQHESVHGVLAA